MCLKAYSQLAKQTLNFHHQPPISSSCFDKNQTKGEEKQNVTSLPFAHH